MDISVFLSHPKPHMKCQAEFIDAVIAYLKGRGLNPRTLGRTDYDMNEPLTAISKLMMKSNGLLTIAFKRSYIQSGKCKLGSDIGEQESDISDQWLTSPFCQIEPAMAFQIGLPILILREKGVIAEGVLEKGVTGTYLPEFDLNKPVSDYLQSEEWKQIINKWECCVRKVVENKGCPPKLY